MDSSRVKKGFRQVIGSIASYLSSGSSSTRRRKYVVFLSFHGEDTRNNFVDHLYAALEQAGIETFKDDKKLQRGECIPEELMKAIQESMVSVVVFSKNYANSTWCLEELAEIIRCLNEMGHKVLPVFYHVDPSDIRGQHGSFRAAFEQHKVKFNNDMEKVKKWREALQTAANISGWHVSITANGSEAESIKQIVEKILRYTESPPDNMIGLESHVQHVKSLLGRVPGDARTIGIWGMGGIGKTTIARTVYRQIFYEFEGSSFLEGVGENGSHKKGLKTLQEKLLSDILVEKHFEVKDLDDGISQIRRRLGHKKVLVVLDGVDNFKQLECLAGAKEWFGPGSRTLITARDEQYLCYAQDTYAPALLDENEAMKLFSRYAFNQNIPPKAYEELSGVVVSHTGHLPLALKVLGSHFIDRNDLDFWESSMNDLGKIQPQQINSILKISFDGLNVDEKEIFLHIACFFKGWNTHEVTRILDCCGYEAVRGISLLIEKSLLTDSHGYLEMHDLIQEMGRWVVREYYPDYLVWIPRDIRDVMRTPERLETVKAIAETKSLILAYRAEALEGMKSLRLLQVQGKFTAPEPTYFPKNLRWLSWYGYPFHNPRIIRVMAKLAGLEMTHGHIQQLRIEVALPNLKYINLCGSSSMTSSPNVSRAPNLEVLNLSFCVSLEKVHQSVFLHKRISHLDFGNCCNLRALPPCIQMKSLETLCFASCKRLECFPEISMETRRLSVLDLSLCEGIRSLPSSIERLTGLTTLNLRKDDFRMSLIARSFVPPDKLSMQSLTHLGFLRVLHLDGNNFVKHDFPKDLHNAWTSLEELDLSSNLMTRVPVSISHVSHLLYLNLDHCNKLKELPELPSLIQVLKANGCTSLEKIQDLSNKYKWLFQISIASKNYSKLLLKDKESWSHIANMLMRSLVNRCAAVNHRLSITVPGRRIPNWFGNKQSGNRITMNVTQNQINKMIGLAICCVFGPPAKDRKFPKLIIKFRHSGEENLIDSPPHGAKSLNHVWLGYMSIDFLGNLFHGLESDDLIMEFYTSSSIMQCGVSAIYKDDIISMDWVDLRMSDVEDARGYKDMSYLLPGPTISFRSEASRDISTVKVLCSDFLGGCHQYI